MAKRISNNPMAPNFALLCRNSAGSGKAWESQIKEYDNMVKYARFVYEKKIEDDTPVDQAGVELDEELQEYIHNNTITANDIEISDKPYSEGQLVTVWPLWVLNKDDILESAERLGLQIKDEDMKGITDAMHLRIANAIGDAWGEALDEEVELVVNNRIAQEAMK